MSATEARRRFLPEADEIAVLLVAPGESVEVVTVRGVKVVTHPGDDGLDGVAMVPGSPVGLGWGLVELHFESGGGQRQ